MSDTLPDNVVELRPKTAAVPENALRFTIERINGTVNHIDFLPEDADWWGILGTQMQSHFPDVLDNIYINTDRELHEQGAWFDRKRELSFTINKAQLLQVSVAFNFILTSTFNGQMPDDLYMALSKTAMEHRVAESIPEYKAALIIHPTLDPDIFRLIWVEC